METINKNEQKTLIDNAIKEIVGMETLPPQIDYISPSERRKYQEALDYIKSLDEEAKSLAEEQIRSQIDSYYEEDENGVSIASLDSMF